MREFSLLSPIKNIYEKLGGRWFLMFAIFCFLIWYNWNFLVANIFPFLVW